MASVIIASLIIIAVYIGTKRLSGLQTMGVVAITLVGILLAVFPGFSSRVAGWLHVGRGTDLIFYLALLAGIFIASNFYFRFKRQEEMLIALTRQSAIDHAQPPPAPRTPSVTERDRPVEQIEQNLH